jgi:quinol monooxygenase YgiN
MLIRIVKLTFKPENVDAFVNTFDEKKHFIASFNGCIGVELLRDINNPNIFFTYSKWNNAESLERYRISELFVSTWDTVKKLFGDKPEAWSVEVYSS